MKLKLVAVLLATLTLNACSTASRTGVGLEHNIYFIPKVDVCFTVHHITTKLSYTRQSIQVKCSDYSSNDLTIFEQSDSRALIDGTIAFHKQEISHDGFADLKPVLKGGRAYNPDFDSNIDVIKKVDATFYDKYTNQCTRSYNTVEYPVDCVPNDFKSLW